MNLMSLLLYALTTGHPHGNNRTPPGVLNFNYRLSGLAGSYVGLGSWVSAGVPNLNYRLSGLAGSYVGLGSWVSDGVPNLNYRLSGLAGS